MSILERYAASRVCDVVKVPGPAAMAILDLAAGRQKVWMLRDWEALLADLDVCEQTVSEWKEFRE